MIKAYCGNCGPDVLGGMIMVTKLTARPWEPQDLLDELQLMIDEQYDSYCNNTRTTLCMAHAYLKEYFAGIKNEPLTLEEICHMKGLPVYLRVRSQEDIHDFEGWALIHLIEPDGLTIQYNGCYRFLHNSWFGDKENEIMNWNAYRSNPVVVSMKCTQERCPIKNIIGSVKRCSAHDCQDRTPPKEN